MRSPLPCIVCILGCLLLGCAGDARAAEPSAAASEGPRPKPVEAPTSGELQASIDRGVDFLVSAQNKNGSWGSATLTKDLNIYAPVPGAHHAFRTAVTALSLSALVEAKDERPEVAESIERGQSWLLSNLPRLKRATGIAIYNVWGHAYSLEALSRLHRRLPDDDVRRERMVRLAEEQVDLLGRYAMTDGGWGYYDFEYRTQQPGGSSISFTTATVLIALKEAQAELNIEIPTKTTAKAVAALQRQRLPDCSYLYGEYLKYRAAAPINRPGGSLGRSQACNLALRLYGDEAITDPILTAWLNRLFARNGWLSIGRKRPIPHESHFQVAGYFYYYGHYYAAQVIEQLPAEARAQQQAQLARTLMPLQEKDGSWWDYPLYAYHRPYGTAMTVMALLRCRTEP